MGYLIVTSKEAVRRTLRSWVKPSGHSRRLLSHQKFEILGPGCFLADVSRETVLLLLNQLKKHGSEVSVYKMEKMGFDELSDELHP